MTFTHKVEGLDQVVAAHRALGQPDQAVNEAAETSGGAIEADARGAAPIKSGLMVSTIRTEIQADRFRVVAGTPTVKHAYTFHAQELGKSKGFFVFRVGAHNRGGRPVRAYVAVRRILSNPFIKNAYERYKTRIPTDYRVALERFMDSQSRGSVN